tara:strand:- start:4977 stop:8438 length:3462 start_codon:yes stop_codon:yes gene_type:complete
MAEEILKYKVEIDSSDVAEQLTSIRNQVDLAMGSLAAQQVKPTTFERIAQVFETANIGSVADQFRQKFETDTTRTIGGITQMLDQTATQMQLGYSRFTADARRLGLLSSTDYPSFTAPLPQAAAVPPMTTTQALAAAGLGVGFDPSGQATMQQYTASAVDQINRDFRNFMNYGATEAGGTILGAGLGMMRGGLGGALAGGIVGNLIGGVGQAGLDLLTAQARQVDSMAGGLAEIAQSQIAGAPGADSGFYTSQAQVLMDMTRSQLGRATGLTLDEVQGQVSSFAAAGGFKGMDLGDMSVALRQLPTAVRAVSQNLNIAQSDASQLLADMNRLQMGGEDLLGSASLALKLNAQAGLVGITPGDMLGTAAQGIQAVAGTTMSPGDAANLAVQSRLLTSQAATAGAPGVSAFVRQQGGAMNAGFANLEQGLRHMMSPIGMARAANIAGGGSETASVQEAMSGAASFFSDDPSRIFSMMVEQGNIVGGMSPLTIQNAQVGDAIGFLRQMPQFAEGAIPANVIGGAMMSMDPSLSASQAMNMVGIASRGSQDFIMNQLMSTRDALVGMDRVNQVGPLRQFVTGVTQPFVNFADATVNKMGRGLQNLINDVSSTAGDVMTEILTGQITVKSEAILNDTTVSELRAMVSGKHEPLNVVRESVKGLKFSNLDFQNLTGKGLAVHRQDAFKNFMNRTDANAPGMDTLRNSAAASQIFATIGFNATQKEKLKLASYLENEKKAGRLAEGDDYDPDVVQDMIGDIIEFDDVMTGFAGRMAQHPQHVIDDIAMQENMLLTSMGEDPLSLLQSEQYKKLSQIDQLEKLWELTGSKVALNEAPMEQRDAFLNIFTRASAQAGGFVDQASFINQFDFTGAGAAGGALGTDLTIDSVVRSALRGSIRDNVAANNVRGEIIGKVSDTFTEEEIKQLSLAAGMKDGELLSEGQIADIILGSAENLNSVGTIRSSLMADGSAEGFTLSGKLMGLRRGLMGKSIKMTIGDETHEMSLLDAIRMEEGLSIKEDVLKRVNELSGEMENLTDLPLDDTVQESLTAIAINEIVSGKSRTFDKNMTGKMSFISSAKEKGALTAELEKALTADIVAVNNDIASAIDFSKQFAGMDDSLRQAGNEMAALEHAIQGAAASRALLQVIDLTDSKKPHLKVKS